MRLPAEENTATVLTLFSWRSTHGASVVSHKTGYAHKEGQLHAEDNRDFSLLKWYKLLFIPIHI